MKNHFIKEDIISDEHSDKNRKSNTVRNDVGPQNNVLLYENPVYTPKESNIQYGSKGGVNEYYGDFYDNVDKGNLPDEKTRSRSSSNYSLYEQAPYYGVNPYSANAYPPQFNTKSFQIDDRRTVYSRSNDQETRYHHDPYQYNDNIYEQRDASSNMYNNNINKPEIDNKRRAKIRVCSNCSTTSTPSWRRSSDHRLLLCNACGLYRKLHGRDRPYNVTSDGRTKAIKLNTDKLRCRNCHTSETSFWRKGPDGLPLCNHCGLYFSNVISLNDNDNEVYGRRQSEPDVRNYGCDVPEYYPREDKYQSINFNDFENASQDFGNRRSYSDVSEATECVYDDQESMRNYQRNNNEYSKNNVRFKEFDQEMYNRESGNFVKKDKFREFGDKEKFHPGEKKDFEK